ASYSGDACYKNGTSPNYAQLVYRATSSVSLTSDVNPSTYGQNVKLTAQVTPTGTSGQAKFYDGGNLIGSASVNTSTGLAVLNVGNFIPGKHDLTVQYPGDSHYEPSTSTNYSQVVNQLPSTTVLSVSPSPAVCQQDVTLTATVTPSDAS